MENENQTFNIQTDTEVADKSISEIESVELSNEATEISDETNTIDEEVEATADKNLVVKATSKKPIIIIASIAVLVIAISIYFFIFSPMAKYNKANNLVNEGKYDEAISIFKDLGNYKDSENKLNLCHYEKGLNLINEKNYDEAISIFKELRNYKDSEDKFNLCSLEKAFILMNKGDYVAAKNILTNLDTNEEIKKQIKLCSHMILYNHIMENGTLYEGIYHMENPDSKIDIQVRNEDKTIRIWYQYNIDSALMNTAICFPLESDTVDFSYLLIFRKSYTGDGVFYPHLYDGNLDNTPGESPSSIAIRSKALGFELGINDIFNSPYMDMTFDDDGTDSMCEFAALQYYIDFSNILGTLSRHIDYIDCGVSLSDFGIILPSEH